MRAVNLIPADARRAASAAGKSGGGVYVLLGALGLVVACVAALTITNRQVAEKSAEAGRLEVQAAAAQAKAGNLATYKQFNQLVKTRSEGVRTLAATRFDWGATLEQVSRVIPADVSLTQLTASTAPGIGSGGGVSLRSALENPAVELLGCAPSQARVALLMARLRRLEGVRRVSVAASTKAEDTQAPSASPDESADTGTCRVDDQTPEFQIVVFFGTPRAAPTQAPATGARGAIETINGGSAGTTTTPAPAAPGS